MSSKKIIAFEGIIGAGKTTLLNELLKPQNKNRLINSKKIDNIFTEDINIWKPYLTLFYENMKRWRVVVNGIK